jgi:hypothetical protein
MPLDLIFGRRGPALQADNLIGLCGNHSPQLRHLFEQGPALTRLAMWS